MLKEANWGMGARKTWGSDGGPEVGLVANHWHCTDGQRWELVANQVFRSLYDASFAQRFVQPTRVGNEA